MTEITSLITNYIEKRKNIDTLSEEVKALETLILDDKSSRTDKRLTFVAGRRTIDIKPKTYENLEKVNVKTEIVITRLKTLKEFDTEIQTAILANPENYIETIGKESIRIKK